MIEVEKKFILTNEQQEQLIKNAEFVGKKTFTDTYFDDVNYSLTINDLWLRERDGKFELKVPMNVSIEERVSDQYRELEMDEEIVKQLNLSKDKPLTRALVEKGYIPFITVTTTRKKYKKDGYGIDLDTMDFGYNIAEIEYMTEDESKIKEATEKIIEYARSYGLSEGVVRGKVAEYLRRNKYEHFQALIDAKVIK